MHSASWVGDRGPEAAATQALIALRDEDAWAAVYGLHLPAMNNQRGEGQDFIRCALERGVGTLAHDSTFRLKYVEGARHVGRASFEKDIAKFMLQLRSVLSSSQKGCLIEPI